MLTENERHELRQNFATFASSTTGDSPAYRLIGEYVSKTDSGILDLFDRVPKERCRAVNLFAAVHYLVLSGIDHPLSRIFLSSQYADNEALTGLALTDFCEMYAEKLVDIMQSRAIQTNEVNRCVSLVLALEVVTQQSSKPLVLVDMGAGAGLNLLFDRYRYEINDRSAIGDIHSSVTLTAQLTGNVDIPKALPRVAQRIGIDLDPVDPFDRDMERWLQASIWVGEDRRAERLSEALSIARKHKPDVRKGNVADVLSDVVSSLPEDFEICLFNSWMLGWCATDVRKQIMHTVEKLGHERPLWWITFEDPTRVPELPRPAVTLPEISVLGLHQINGMTHTWSVLAQSDHHSSCVAWVQPRRQQ